MLVCLLCAGEPSGAGGILAFYCVVGYVTFDVVFKLGYWNGLAAQVTRSKLSWSAGTTSAGRFFNTFQFWSS